MGLPTFCRGNDLRVLYKKLESAIFLTLERCNDRAHGGGMTLSAVRHSLGPVRNENQIIVVVEFELDWRGVARNGLNGRAKQYKPS